MNRSLPGRALRKVSPYDNQLTAFPHPNLPAPESAGAEYSCNQLDRLPPEYGQLQQLEMFDFVQSRERTA